MENFDKRAGEFNRGILELQKKHGVSLYAANVVLKNGEVAPMVRLADVNKNQEMIINPSEKNNENKSKRRNSRNKKA